MAWSFIYTKLHSLTYLSITLCPIRLKLANWFWRMRFLKIINVLFFFYILISSIHGNRMVLRLINSNFLFYPGKLCARFVWNLLCGSGEENLIFEKWVTTKRDNGKNSSEPTARMSIIDHRLDDICWLTDTWRESRLGDKYRRSAGRDTVCGSRGSSPSPWWTLLPGPTSGFDTGKQPL